MCVISGDLTWDALNQGKASVRNVGNTRLAMRVVQDDMGFGMTDGAYNVSYKARVGSGAVWASYNPNASAKTLADELDLSELDEMDFSIYVKKFPPQYVGDNYNGTMTLSAVSKPHLTCPIAAPVVDGVVNAGEWEGCTELSLTGDKGTACIIAYPDYMYVLYQLNDPTDDRALPSSPGNDKLGININPDPTQPLGWGKPYDIVFQTGSDPAAFTTPSPDEPGSSGLSDGWETEWVIGNDQLPLPASVQTMTPAYAGLRISEWRIPLSSISGLVSGSILKVGGGADIESGSYSFPTTLNWADPYGTFVDIIVK